MGGMIAYRDLSNALFPFCSCVKRKLQLMFCMIRNRLVFLMSFYTFKVLSRPEFKVKVRTVVQRKAYFHLPNNSGSSFSCPVYPLARAFTHAHPQFELMLLQVQKLVLGKGLLFLFTPVLFLHSGPKSQLTG